MAKEAIRFNNMLWPASRFERTRGYHTVVQWFENVSMANGHDGLWAIANKAMGGADLYTLEPGQFVVFTSKARDKIKIFTANGCIAYRRLKRGTITLDTVASIPLAFQSVTKKVDTMGLPEQFIEKKREPGKRILIRQPGVAKK